jgi:hydroxymethylpyrimidine/phosphomethylpyrimidine kinase
MTARVLCIGQTDPTAKSGIQADMKAVLHAGAQAYTVVTAVSVQNDAGIQETMPVPDDIVRSQIEAVLEEDLPHAVKTGMFCNSSIVNIVGDTLEPLLNKGVPLVIDPVISTRGHHKGMSKDGIDAMKRRLLIHADVLMPNVMEAEMLTGLTIRDHEDKCHAAEMLITLGARTIILTSGAKDRETLDDFLISADEQHIYEAEGRPSLRARGAETRLTAGVAACMAQGLSAKDAYEKVRNSLDYDE